VRFDRVFAGRAGVVNALGIGAWLSSLAYFWWWWLQPSHFTSGARFTLVTLLLVWLTIVPIYFILIFARARTPGRDETYPGPARVAMVVTKTPSEPFDLVKSTLIGMLQQEGVDHDTWLADEDPSPSTLRWCRTHGVNVCTRKGVEAYHRTDWPRRTRCKEGNLAYFYDRYGYERYDFVAQFDADHRPDPGYLKRAIAPFADPAVGYVSAPSICDSNADKSWSARGRLYIEASMHGALQSGYNSGWAPLCIGSHYVVRTAALRSVGGLGPELAEDHSTTLLLNAGGWRGVHAVDAIAHGEGPETFADLVVQEFQWARSLVTIFLKYSPIYVPRLHARIRFQFLFSQLWYPLFSTMMAVMFIMPIFALLTGTHFANVTYIDFFIHILPLVVTLLVLAFWWRSTGLFRPADAKILSWEGIAFLLLRWPWSLLGSLAAVRDWITGSVADFRVTPKGVDHRETLLYRFVAPYAILSSTSGFTAWLVADAGTAGGFYIFALINAAIYAALVALIIIGHGRENRQPLITTSVSGLKTAFSVLVMFIGIVGAVEHNCAKGLYVITHGIDSFSLTKMVYPVAGAGQGNPYAPQVELCARWHGFLRLPEASIGTSNAGGIEMEGRRE
jgi:cellulose synthase (UDP-forming)